MLNSKTSNHFALTCKTLLIMFLLLADLYPQRIPGELIQKALNVSFKHLEMSVSEVKDTARYPSYAPHELKWDYSSSGSWTSGFYPGCLWLTYDLSHNDLFMQNAKKWTNGLAREKGNRNTHDLGFMINCSFGNGLRFVAEPEAKKYKDIMLEAALTLDKRFDPRIGLLRCYWDEEPYRSDTTLYPVVVDIMMNLELLFWAAENGAPGSLREHAMTHALNSYRDFVRADGSTYHVVRYNINTGRVINRGTLQGQSDSSTWTRGHAWFIYGTTVCYRYTKDEVFLKNACALADYFLKRITPDNVSDWDFDPLPKYKNIKDASATAITASALFELKNYVKDTTKSKFYYKKAADMLSALCSDKYLASNENTNAILLHSTQYLTQPGNQNTDRPAIFADYYFLESIKRYLLSIE